MKKVIVPNHTGSNDVLFCHYTVSGRGLDE